MKPILILCFLLGTMLFPAQKAVAACTSPFSMTISNIALTSADVLWPGVSGAGGYFVSYNTVPTPNPGNTTYSTSMIVSLSALTCGTKYFVFIRSYCGVGDTSSWITDSFTTNNCCYPPVSVTATATSAVSGQAVIGASPSTPDYEYSISTNSTPPVSGVSTSSTTILLPGLLPNTVYYFCIRAKCSSGEPYSQWVCDTLKTPNCDVPDSIVIQSQGSDSLIRWSFPPGVTGFDYYISTVPSSSPATWVTTSSNTFITSSLQPDSTYYICVRAHCTSPGFTTAWTCDTFHIPAGINRINSESRGLKLYPNPARDKLIVETDEWSPGAQLILTGLTGNTIYRQTVTGKQTTIDVSEIAAGMYFVKYSSPGITKTMIVVKE